MLAAQFARPWHTYPDGLRCDQFYIFITPVRPSFLLRIPSRRSSNNLFLLILFLPFFKSSKLKFLIQILQIMMKKKELFKFFWNNFIANRFFLLFCSYLKGVLDVGLGFILPALRLCSVKVRFIFQCENYSAGDANFRIRKEVGISSDDAAIFMSYEIWLSAGFVLHELIA